MNEGEVRAAVDEEINGIVRKDEDKLFEYFNHEDGTEILKDFSSNLQKKTKESFCDLICLIFSLAGVSVPVSTDQFDGLLAELMIKDYESEISDVTIKPPINALTSGKNNRVETFWSSIAKIIISSHVIFNKEFLIFRHWLGKLCVCNQRYVRYSAAYSALTILSILLDYMKNIEKDIDDLKNIQNQSPAVKEKCTDLENERYAYLSISNYICNTLLLNLIRDKEVSIKYISVSVLCKAIVSCPKLYSSDNHMISLENSLVEQIKIKQLAIKSLHTIYSSINLEYWKNSSERLKNYIVFSCNDVDTIISEYSLKILNIFSLNSILDVDDIDQIIPLLCDNSPIVRENASVFIKNVYFGNAETNDECIDKLLSLLEKNIDIKPCLQCLYDKLQFLSDWEFLCSYLINHDNPNNEVISKIINISSMLFTEKNHDSEEKLRSFTLIMLDHLSNLIISFQAHSSILINIIQTIKYLRFDIINEYSETIPSLFAKLREIFLSSNDESIYVATSSILYEISKKSHLYNDIAKAELDRLAVNCGDISLDNINVAISKFLAASKYVNMSDKENVRKVLFDTAEKDTSDDELLSKTLSCLDLFFQWDIYDINKNNNQEMADNYQWQFARFLNAFSSNLCSNNQKVLISSLSGMSSLFSLSNLLNRDFVVFDDTIVEQYCKAFHKITNKKNVWKIAIRPFLCNTISFDFAVYFLIYIYSDDLKSNALNLWDSLKKYAPLNGKYIPLILYQLKQDEVDDEQIHRVSKWMFKKFTSFDAIHTFLDQNIREIFDYMVPFFFSLTPKDAEILESGNQELERIFERIRSGAKIKPSDFKTVSLE